MDKTRPKLLCLGFSDSSSKRDFSFWDGCGSLPDPFALQPQASIGDTTAYTDLSALGIPFPTTAVLAPLEEYPKSQSSTISKFDQTNCLNTGTFSFPSCISFYMRNRTFQLSASNALVLYKVLNNIFIRKILQKPTNILCQDSRFANPDLKPGLQNTKKACHSLESNFWSRRLCILRKGVSFTPSKVKFTKSP